MKTMITSALITFVVALAFVLVLFVLGFYMSKVCVSLLLWTEKKRRHWTRGSK